MNNNNNDNYNHIIRPIAREKRTVIVYLGIFFQYLEMMNNKKRYIRILTKVMAKSTVKHKAIIRFHHKIYSRRTRKS